MNHNDDPSRMRCPRCGMDQAAAPECGFCGVVVGKYHKGRKRFEATPLITGGSIFAVLLFVVAGVAWWKAFSGLDQPEPTFTPAPERPPDVVTPADPSELGKDWFSGAFGFRQAVETQIDLKVPMIVYVRRRECAECAGIQAELLNGPELTGAAKDALRVKVDVDGGPDDAALAGKLGAVELPALVVIRSDGKRTVVPLLAGDPPVRVSAEALVADYRAASGR